MATAETPISDQVTAVIVQGDELSTTLIFRELDNTARGQNSVSDRMVEVLRGGGDFESVRELVAGRR